MSSQLNSVGLAACGVLACLVCSSCTCSDAAPSRADPHQGTLVLADPLVPPAPWESQSVALESFALDAGAVLEDCDRVGCSSLGTESERVNLLSVSGCDELAVAAALRGLQFIPRACAQEKGDGESWKGVVVVDSAGYVESASVKRIPAIGACLMEWYGRLPFGDEVIGPCRIVLEWVP